MLMNLSRKGDIDREKSLNKYFSQGQRNYTKLFVKFIRQRRKLEIR